jgi:SAM-dependent methyltransferase
MPWLKSGINKFIPSPIWQPFPPIKETLKLLKSDSVILDIGAGGRKIDPRVICVDKFPFPNTDVCSDIESLPFQDNYADCIFCTGTFEHIKNPDLALKEFWRVLKEEGFVHIEVPFMQPYHADPQDYYRWTLEGIKYYCEKYSFRELSSGVHLGPVSAMNVIIIQFCQSFFENKIVRKIIDVFFSIILFPLKYLDYFLIRKKKAHYFASGVYFVGRKMVQ